MYHCTVRSQNPKNQFGLNDNILLHQLQSKNTTVKESKEKIKLKYSLTLIFISRSTAGSKVTGVWSQWKVKGISSSRRLGLVLLMFHSDVYLLKLKPKYKLMDTLLLLIEATEARF